MLFNPNRPSVMPALLAGALLALAPLTGSASAQAPGLDPVELEIWDDPDFKRRFAESYLSNTEVEPPITLEEREVLIKVFAILDPGSDEAGEEGDKKPKNKQEAQEPAPEPDGSELAEALALLEEFKATSENKVSATIYFFTANLRMQQGLKTEPAEGATEQEAESARLAARNKLLQAADDFETAISKFPKFRRAHRNLGLLRVRLQQFDKAARSFARVISLGGGDSDTYGLMGYCYTQLKQYLPAESAYRMANLMKPDEQNWKMGLVNSFFFQKRYAEVAALTGEMIQKDPNNTELWMLQANAYIGLDKPMQAAENYEFVDGLGRSTVQSLSMLANIYTNAKLQDAAATAYLKALDKAGGTEQAASLADQMLRGAKVLLSQGAYTPTKRMIARVEEALGDTLSDEKKKGWLKLSARIAVAEGASGDEVAVLKQIVELDPLDGEAIILLGDNAARTGEVEDAIFYFERAASLEGFEAEAKLHHAKVLVKEKRYSEALPLLYAAQQIKPQESVQRFIEQIEQVNRSQ